jgi:hypothetical protein
VKIGIWNGTGVVNGTIRFTPRSNDRHTEGKAKGDDDECCSSRRKRWLLSVTNGSKDFAGFIIFSSFSLNALLGLCVKPSSTCFLRQHTNPNFLTNSF